MSKNVALMTAPLRASNPVTVQVLGICSALAVTTALTTALTMCLALSFVLCSSSVLISLLRVHIPSSTRLIIQITIIASLVIIVDLFLKVYLFDISQRLSVFVSLIVTNCLVLGRAEAFAMKNPVFPSFLDAVGNSAGYSLVLIAVASLRELLGTGKLLGYQLLIPQSEGGWFQPVDFMMKAPSAFFIIAMLVWVGHSKARRSDEPKHSASTQIVTRERGSTND